MFDESSVTAQGVMGTLRCGNPDCNHTLAQVHAMGAVIFRVLECPGCHRASEYENTSRGWTIKLMPAKRQASVAPQRLQQVKPR